MTYKPQKRTDRPIRAPFDVLGEVLSDVRLHSTVFSLFELRSPWGIEKHALPAAPFHVVVEGTCWLRLGTGVPLELGAGDLVILPHGDAHALTSGSRTRGVSFDRVLARMGFDPSWSPGMRVGPPMTIRYGGGEGRLTRVISGVCTFNEPRRHSLVQALPPLLHVSSRAEPSIEHGVRTLLEETASKRPGAQAVTERTAEILFVQAIRTQLERGASDSPGWIRGLVDAHIARTLAAIHGRPAHSWTVGSLARIAGVSRSLLATRFRALVGSTVMGYVTNRRMQAAAELLHYSTSTLSDVAARVGYGSEIVFGRAFLAWSGMSPGRYRRHVAKKSGFERSRSSNAMSSPSERDSGDDGSDTCRPTSSFSSTNRGCVR